MDDALSENEETVYTYYTIVNENEEQDSDNVIYFTIGQQNEVAEPEQPSSGVFEENDSIAELPDYKVISLEDGGLYVTDAGENIESTEQQTLSDDAINFISDDANVALDENESNDAEEYQEVKLADGTHAIIERKLWTTFMESMEGTSTFVETQSTPDGSKKSKKHPCMYLGCNKVYSSAQHLTVHVRNHTGDRPYDCPAEGCDKAFATGYSLKAHLRTHTGETPYSCSSCTKQFKTSGDLQKHIRTHTGEKPFKCPIDGCNRSFTTSNIRKVHIRSHTGERPYVCHNEKCGKAFASATNFKNHMRIHSGEKPYLCPVSGCNKRFTEYSSLYKHNMVHKPFKPYKCDYCGQLCKVEATLKAHKRTMHGVVFAQDGMEIMLTPNYPDVSFAIGGLSVEIKNDD